MSIPPPLILGEFHRTLDGRFRLSIPRELLDQIFAPRSAYFLAKERPGCLSLWPAAKCKSELEVGLELLKQKMQAGKLDARTADVQRLARLLSTRHKAVELAGRGRLVIPEGFREFLRVEPGGEVLLVGAGLCIEIWNPQAWLDCLERQIPEFRQLFEQLTS